MTFFILWLLLYWILMFKLAISHFGQLSETLWCTKKVLFLSIYFMNPINVCTLQCIVLMNSVRLVHLCNHCYSQYRRLPSSQSVSLQPFPVHFTPPIATTELPQWFYLSLLDYQTNGMVRYAFISVWLLSLRIMLLRLIHAVACHQ